MGVMPQRHGLVAMCICVLALLAPGAQAERVEPPSRDEVRRMVQEEAGRSVRVPASLALAVAEAESDFVADALSPAGARGVMQIMPATALGEFGVHADALWEAEVNVRLGIAFLDQLIERYDGRWDLALSHYNGGSRVGRGRDARVIPATRAYVDKVLAAERRYAGQLAPALPQVRVAQASDGPVLPILRPGTVRPAPVAVVDLGRPPVAPEDTEPISRVLSVRAHSPSVPSARAHPLTSSQTLLDRIEHRKARFRTLMTES